MLKKLLSNSAIYGIAPQIPQIANIIILPIITEDLTKLDYGVAGTIYAYLAALSAFHLLGLPLILSNGFFHHLSQYKWLWRQIHGFLSIWSIIYSVLVGILIFFIIPEDAIENRWTIVLLHTIPSALFNVTTEYGRIFYQLSQKPIPIAVQIIVIGFITIFLNLYLISYQHMGYMGWFWSRFAGAMLAFLFFFYPIYIKHKFLPIFNFKWRLLKEKLKIAVRVIPYYYGRYLLQASDRVVMNSMSVSTDDIGTYSLASNFGGYFDSFINGSAMATSPMIYEYFAKFNREDAFKIIRELIFLWQAAMIVASFLLCLWFKEVFEVLIKNPDLHDAYPLAIIMIMGYNYRPLYGAFIEKLFYYEKAKNIWKITFIAGALNVVLNLIFIPFYGIEAAAITTFVAYLYLGLSGFFMTDYKDMKDLNYYPAYWLLGISLATVLVFFIKDIYWVYKVGITLSILAVCLGWILKNKEFLSSFDIKKHKKNE